MKQLLLLLSLMHISLSAAVGDRYHSCMGEGASLSFAESSFLNEPMVTFKNGNSISWSGADIEIRESSEISGAFVEVLDAAQRYPIMLKFFALRPDDSSEAFHNYHMIVDIFNLNTNTATSMPMKCYSQKVYSWPVNLANL